MVHFWEQLHVIWDILWEEDVLNTYHVWKEDHSIHHHISQNSSEELVLLTFDSFDSIAYFIYSFLLKWL